MRFGLYLGATAALLSWSSGAARADQFAYGLDDNNRIVVVQLDGSSPGTAVASYSTGLTSPSNSLARDTVNERLLFRSPEDGTAGNPSQLYAFSLTTHAFSLVAGGASLPEPSASAAFYNGAYWYVRNNSNTLVRVQFDGSGNVANFTTTALNPAGGTYGFGDIVITSTGLLYGSSDNTIFSVQLTETGGFGGTISTSAFTPLTTSDAGNLQLTLGTDGTLYGYQHPNSTPNSTDRAWFAINTTTGARGDALFYTPNSSFRDLADTAAVPEPSSLAICALGGLAMAWRVRRGMQKKSA